MHHSTWFCIHAIKSTLLFIGENFVHLPTFRQHLYSLQWNDPERRGHNFGCFCCITSITKMYIVFCGAFISIVHRYIYVDFHRLKAPYGTINRVAAFRYYVIKGIHFLEHAFLIIPLSLSHSPSLCSTIHSALTEREFG